ncbi:MAG: PASTA domain-containing protein [Candidatus Cloacimonetes bacterium]|nr:PASTA domain-containing protein [Candidatus Cloacimonadota bacterium]
MAKTNTKQWGYMFGIGIGIIFVTAFFVSQLLLPLIFGRPDTIQTPEVIGLNLSKAKRILQEEKLHVVVKDSLFNESVKMDIVLEQSPVPGAKIKEDGTVFLIISKGSKMVSVPNVIGSSFQDAMLVLRMSNLRGSVIDSVYSDTTPQNADLRSSPNPNSKVEKHSMVRLTLSRGSQPVTDSLNWLFDESGL